ncbi:hypothetical protein GCM10028778_20850 [Barrientosiimonas marina]
MIDLLLIAGVFIIIYIDIPIFKKKVYDYSYVGAYLILIAIQTINSAFIHFISDSFVLGLTIAILSPLVIKFISRPSQKEKIEY